MHTDKGLKRLKQLYLNRDGRARELKEEGNAVIGYLCSFAPPEIIAAAGILPYRIMGKLGDSITEADSYIEPYGCPYIRNCFDQDLKNKHDFLDGFVMAHSCDMAQRVYGIWKYYQKPRYSYFFNVPHQIRKSSQDFFAREIEFFAASIEEFTQVELNNEQIKETISLYNQNRKQVREIFELRKLSPPPISGTEVMMLLVVGLSIPAAEFQQLLSEILDELRDIPSKATKAKRPRVMIWGSILDDIEFLNIIESCGLDVVTDDTCIGTRTYNEDVEITDNINQGLMTSYFKNFKCPRTDRGPGMDRFSYFFDLINEFNVEGVIAYTIAFCDPHKLDFPDLRDLLEEKSVPSILIDDDYTLANKEAIRNRLQTFAEILKTKNN